MSATQTGAGDEARATLAAEPKRSLTVADYHRMIDAGILGDDDRVELLEGVIVEVSPQSEAHAQVIVRLNRLLVRALGDEFEVRPQLPLILGDRNEPEPDLAVVRSAGGWSEHPKGALLVIEVAGESLRKDRLLKGDLYARLGVPEYWVVNLETHAIEVHRDPGSDGRYRSVRVAGHAEELSATAVPGIRVRVADLFD